MPCNILNLLVSALDGLKYLEIAGGNVLKMDLKNIVVTIFNYGYIFKLMFLLGVARSFIPWKK